MIPFPNKKYNIIYADPAWQFNHFGRDKRKGNPLHYELLTINQIKNLPVKSIADNNCFLFLWVIDQHLDKSFDVIKSWGFNYKTIAFTWVKKTKHNKDHFGTGVWTRKNPEICLLATKGKPKRQKANVRQLQKHLVREHSRKPDEIRNEIIRLCGDLPKIELFARQRVQGWDCWGNEV
tara:strand:- start:181 stop:714 length:534 start_codon:yes stop_codon:yes gene_type:complete